MEVEGGNTFGYSVEKLAKAPRAQKSDGKGFQTYNKRLKNLNAAECSQEAYQKWKQIPELAIEVVGKRSLMQWRDMKFKQQNQMRVESARK